MFTPISGSGAIVHAVSLVNDRDVPRIRKWLDEAHGRVVTEPAHDTTLQPDDLIALQSLLGYYRTRRSMGCTTIDTLVFTLRRGRTLREEQYVDGSCFVLMDYKGLTLYDLIPHSHLQPASGQALPAARLLSRPRRGSR